MCQGARFDPKVPHTGKALDSLRTDAEKQIAYMGRADAAVEQTHDTFTMFMISEINQHVHASLPCNPHKLEDLVRELRDLYFVYTDGLHGELLERKMLARRYDVPLREARHQTQSRETYGFGSYQEVLSKSLRYTPRKPGDDIGPLN